MLIGDMLISVIVTTYNRAAILKEALTALESQSMSRDKYEIIVVDDGSTDQTKEIMKGVNEFYPNITYLKQKNSGQGIARNFGVTKAKGEIVILTQDDIIVGSDFLEQHLKIHLRHPSENIAVLGFTTWDPRLPISPVMRWMTNGSSIFGKFGGHQFAYEKLKGKEEADYNFFYTSNISLKKVLMQKYPFDPSFSGYGWEDIELGYRLHKRVGLKVIYNSAAIAYHYHLMSETDMKNRMYSIGESAWVIDRKYPELKKIPSGLKMVILQILSSGIVLFVLKLTRNMTQGFLADLYYYSLSKKYFLMGINGKNLN